MTRLIRSPWTLAIAIALAAVAWMASGALQSDATGERPSTRADDDAAATPRLTAVQIREQSSQRVERQLELSGRTAPARRVVLKAETTGRIVAAPAGRGQRLDAGAVLLRLETADREVRLSEARAAVRQRELEYESQKALAPDGFITEARVAEALALLERARTELRRAELDLERMTVRAPFDGVLLEREVEIGDYVTPGDPLLTWLDDRTLIVAANVNETDIGHLSTGMQARATLVDGAAVGGQLRYIAPLAEASTRTFLVELELDNPGGEIPLGAGAKLHLPLDTVDAWPVSPALLALDDAGDLGLKIVDDDDRVRLVDVDVVRAGADTVWVTGLPDPARIITVGQGFVSHGEQVLTRREDGGRSRTAERVVPGAETSGGRAGLGDAGGTL